MSLSPDMFLEFITHLQKHTKNTQQHNSQIITSYNFHAEQFEETEYHQECLYINCFKPFFQ